MRSDLDVASRRTARSSQSAVPAACRFTTASYCPDIDQAEPIHPVAISRPNRTQAPCFELAFSSSDRPRPGVGYLVSNRPVALLSLVPRPAVLFTAGALSGAIGKTLTAPLDRVKLLLQTSGGLQKGAVRQAVRQGGVWQALVAIGRTEGVKGYWKGNLPQVWCTPCHAHRWLKDSSCSAQGVQCSGQNLCRLSHATCIIIWLYTALPYYMQSRHKLLYLSISWAS